MISVVTPARGRPDLTRQFIESAYDTASSPDNIEMIFRFDDCDPDLAELEDVVFSVKRPTCWCIVGSRLFGYSSMHEMTNEMCARANEKSVGMMIGNNDMRFKSKDWDLGYESIIKNNPIAIIQVKRNRYNGTGMQFPLITKAVHQILGHYALHPSLDGYISWVGIMARCMVYSNVEVEHDHFEGDDVYTDRIDSDKEKQHTFRAEETQRLIVEDAKKLSAEIGLIELADFYGWR